MSKFLVLYQALVSAADQMAQATPEQAQAGMEAWMAWAGRVGSALVDMGAPLGPEERIPAGASGDGGFIAGFSIVEADSMAAAGDLLRDHPHLHTPGDSSIRVFEFLPIPGA
jgi:hypothetical protein